MKTIKIIISIAVASVMLVAGIAYFSTLVGNKVGSDTSAIDTVQNQNTASTTNTVTNPAISKPLINNAEREDDETENEETGQATQSPQPTRTPTPGSITQPSSNQCIVTISGGRYDVQPLRNTHPGGDIFICNTDMTSIFFGQHGQSLLNSTMQKYRLP